MTETKCQAYSKVLVEPLRSLKTIFGRVFAKRAHQLNIVLNNISQGVCMFDPSQRLVVCNERYLQMYNLSAEVVRPGCTLRELIDHRQATGLLHDDPEEYCRKILESNSQARTLELVVELADRSAVGTFHVVSENLQLRLGIDDGMFG